ncbi:Hypothetical predicted protein, partial [Paramuricea clavata]
MESKKFTCDIFTDLKKAFDTVDHSNLLTKLNHYGIRGLIHDWFNSYLSDRSQTLLIGNCTSEVISCSYGVPQGSVLGPLLFLLYINDITSFSDNYEFCLFADDTSMLYPHCDIHALERIVNDELRK